ncbi:MAG: hypothetical protein CMN05_12870 [Roseibacillus sp.]|nr:hypothetical protein [Roseibacillus sp.]MBP36512.1 hypothetical protein [Roseibacillus sp.]
MQATFRILKAWCNQKAILIPLPPMGVMAGVPFDYAQPGPSLLDRNHPPGAGLLPLLIIVLPDSERQTQMFR